MAVVTEKVLDYISKRLDLDQCVFPLTYPEQKEIVELAKIGLQQKQQAELDCLALRTSKTAYSVGVSTSSPDSRVPVRRWF